jgi:diphthamide synthase (EF-2-diphthine--ammonia ligase)
VRAKLTCVDPAKLDASFAGRDFDEALLRDLPAGIDPCGQNGEFHTCVYEAPVFSSPISVRTVRSCTATTSYSPMFCRSSPLTAGAGRVYFAM